MQPPPPPPLQQHQQQQQQQPRQHHLNQQQQEEQSARQKQHLQQQMANAPPTGSRVPLKLLSGSNVSNVHPEAQQQEMQKRGRRTKRPTVIMRPPEIQAKPATKAVEPCGALGELRPGIIRHMRTPEHIQYILATIAGSTSFKRPQSLMEKPQPAKKPREDPEASLSLEGMFKKEEESLDTASCPDSQVAAAGDPEDLEMDEQAQLEKEDSDDMPSHEMSPAAQYFELIKLDIKGRINAVKRSRRKVTAAMVMKDDILYTTSKSYDVFCVPKSENDDPEKLRRQYDLQMGKWKALFSTMDTALGSEYEQLENELNRVQAMQKQIHGG